MALREARGLGALIRPARERMGWTQEELAERVQLDKSYISAIERGTRQWPRESAGALAEALGLDLVEMAVAAEILPEAARRRPSTVYDYYPPDDPAQDVLRAMEKMDYETRKALRDYARFIAGATNGDHP